MEPKAILRNKKGVELSMNTIIIAAIALIVLIVLVIILTGNAGKFNIGLKDCKGKGGVEANTVKECTDNGGVVVDSTFYEKDADGKIKKAPGETRVCCGYS